VIRKFIAAVGVSSAALLGLALPASAEVIPPNCQNNDGYQQIVATAPVNALSNGARIGTVELCREGTLYFGFVIFNSPMTVSEYAQVYFDRYDNGSLVGTVTCDSPGGNERVMPGQTRCWTPNLNGDAVRYTFRAWSDKYSSHTGALLASGATVRIR
jgi:hypothetical protein